MLGELSPDEKILQSHIRDLIEISGRGYKACFSRFLTEREQIVAEAVAHAMGFSGYRFFSGHEGGERAVFGVSGGDDAPDDAAFPVCAVTVRYRKIDVLTHRDFLGAIMSLMIKRESVGDILIREGIAVLFLLDSVAEIVSEELVKVKNAGVECAVGYPAELPGGPEFEDIEGVISSLRLDCLVAMLTDVSREKAEKLIRSGIVTKAGVECKTPSKLVSEEEKISIKGYGKYIFCGTGEKTKKGRIHINCKKYR